MISIDAMAEERTSQSEILITITQKLMQQAAPCPNMVISHISNFIILPSLKFSYKRQHQKVLF